VLVVVVLLVVLVDVVGLVEEVQPANAAPRPAPSVVNTSRRRTFFECE